MRYHIEQHDIHFSRFICDTSTWYCTTCVMLCQSFDLPCRICVINMKNDSEGSVIGRQFLAIGKAKIDMETGELILKFNKENMVFNTYQWTPYVEDLETCFQLEEKGSGVHKQVLDGRQPVTFNQFLFCRIYFISIQDHPREEFTT